MGGDDDCDRPDVNTDLVCLKNHMKADEGYLPLPPAMASGTCGAVCASGSSAPETEKKLETINAWPLAMPYHIGNTCERGILLSVMSD